MKLSILLTRFQRANYFNEKMHKFNLFFRMTGNSTAKPFQILGFTPTDENIQPLELPENVTDFLIIL